MELHVRVHGRPAPEGSHEVGQNGYVMHSSKYLESWRATVNRDTRKAYLAAGLTGRDMPLIPNPRPAYLAIVHWLQDDQGRAAGTDDPTGTPDVDKLLRATIDGLAAARVFANDSQVVECYTTKQRGREPGADIIISDRPLQRPEGEITIMGSNFPPYRLTLERLSGDETYEDGSPRYETVFMLADRPEVVRSAGVATLGALLGDVAVSVTEPTGGGDAPAAEPTKPARKPRKTAAAPAEQPAPVPAGAPVPVAAPEPTPAPQAPAQPAPPVNPFAR